jgi:hypothetical protein
MTPWRYKHREMPAKITIFLDEPTGTINPNLYGHFAEHLGSCVNGGLWVGEDSPIPNTAGLRDDVIEVFHRIAPPSSAGPAGASPTTTTGATASARGASGPSRCARGPENGRGPVARVAGTEQAVIRV